MSSNIHPFPNRFAGWWMMAVVATCISIQPQGAAVERWADPNLKVTNGLMMWLDVSRQQAARTASGLSALRFHGEAPEIALDASGNRRHLHQSILSARPRFEPIPNGAAFSLDGATHHFTSLVQGAVTRELTMMVVANVKAAGGFAGILAANGMGRNDYTSGFNFDLGFNSQPGRIPAINVEGPGFSGQANLLKAPVPLGQWHVFTVVIGRTNGVRAWLDGVIQGSRPRTSLDLISLEELTVGARRYSNSAEKPHAQGFFKGALAEVLLFDRELADSERRQAETYLMEKYAGALRGEGLSLVKEGVAPLIPASNPPPIQMHFPGFDIDELPLELTNVNSVRCRQDGTLIAVGYDGRIWLLKDTNGDELEDHTALFHDGRDTLQSPIGAVLTPVGYGKGDGLFIPVKGRLALIVDTNGDGRSDRDITVAPTAKMEMEHRVDALGVAMDAQENLYFSLGAANFTSPYLLDPSTGRARYTTQMERGTVIRISADFTKREIFATGIRFAVGMAFNPLGDLFVTDQEGATWQPDGNPFDELLHVQKERHYGFPARHPRHLPTVVDEPSVFDYGPQHQSTCGLAFNEPITTGGSNWGPAHWRSDALVAGYSRGKLWRTQLVKTGHGYVARTDLLASLQELAADVCVTTRGDLIVATHSGLPDWGSGPGGKGRLWRIRYKDRTQPQPVLAWNVSPHELKVAFDRPLSSDQARRMATTARIEGGAFVHPGDRFETLRPGYQVIDAQLLAPRFSHEALSVQLSPDRRTLSLLTRPRTAAWNYAVTLGWLPQIASTSSPPEMDLLTSLHGVEATWKAEHGQDSHRVWLPHPDLAVSKAMTLGSIEHEAFFKDVERSGRLELHWQLDLWEMLHPAIQPGSKLDWERSLETVVIGLDAKHSWSMQASAPWGESIALGSQPDGTNTIKLKPSTRGWVRCEAHISTSPGTTFTIDWSTTVDPRKRAFPLRRFFVPWAQAPTSTPQHPSADPAPRHPDLAGGQWLEGRKLFFGSKLACAKCHQLRGEGTSLGPDLSNLIHRDFSSVRKDIEFPSAAIHPDHSPAILERTDGSTTSAILLGESNGVVRAALPSGSVELIPKSEISAVRPSQVSLMPEGLWSGMSAQERKDLMTFLLTDPLPPHPTDAEVQGQPRPPARSLAEIRPLLRDAANGDSGTAPFKVLLCASPKDAGHGAPGFHDYPLWRERWSKLFGLMPGVEVQTADKWPSSDQWKWADVVAFYHDNPAWASEKAADLDGFLARGGGLVFIHWSMNAYRGLEELKQRLWRAWGPGAKFRYGVEELRFGQHELTQGFPSQAQFTDEAYWKLPGGEGEATIIATSREDQENTPQVWVREQGKGRVFVCIPGHFSWTFDDPLYRVMLLRGFAWSGRQPLSVFDDLVLIGARFKP
ncbi:MAG: hypothetical protein FJ405_00710 [Verrucomicrobia bacterium]|nr:hypothetical protein [Verrucomicrobiota bacterium]